MKYTINKIEKGEDELILNYLDLSPEIEKIINFMKGEQTKLIGKKDNLQTIIDSKTILYIECVDGKTFAYTNKDVFKIDYNLYQVEGILRGINFFRCSKSMIINIDMVSCLRSLPSNRIDAMMENGEHIIISRTYASEFRKILKGGSRDE